MTVVEELERLHALKKDGAISEAEFEEAKAALLAKPRSAGDSFSNAVSGLSDNPNSWSMLIHLSQFCTYLLPFAGIVVPIILWQIKKDESDIIDQHGRIVVNFIITQVILAVVFGLLCFVLIGIPLLILLGIIGVIFPIIGAIKANNGELWPYPGSFTFFTVDR